MKSRGDSPRGRLSRRVAPRHRRTPRVLALLGAGALVTCAALISGCSSPPNDVTSSAGDPITSADASGEPRPDKSNLGTPETVTPAGEPSAPRCPTTAGAAGGQALPCLGPGPAMDVLGLPGVAVIPVWASWCAPCREELPIMSELADSGVQVVGVAAADNAQAATALAEELQITFPSVQDPESATRATLGWSALPATFVVREGEVVARINGTVTSSEQIRQAIEDAR